MLWGVAGCAGDRWRGREAKLENFRAEITVKIGRSLNGRLGPAPRRLGGGRERIYGGKVAAKHAVGVLGHRRTVCSPPPSATAMTSDTNSHHLKQRSQQGHTIIVLADSISAAYTD